VDDPAPVDVDRLHAELERRVAQRRARGDYPDDLVAALDAQWAALVDQREDGEWPGAEVERHLAALDDAGRFSSERIDLGGGPPARRTVHQVAARLVTRQVEGILAQARAHAGAVRSALGSQWSAIAVLEARQSRLEQRLESALDKLARYERGDGPPAVVDRELGEELRRARRRLGPFRPPWRPEELAEAVGGATDRAAALAARIEAGPVLDLDPDLGAHALLAGRGLEVEAADPGALASRDDASLGGVLAGRAVERLGAGELVDLVAEAARALRPGGRLVADAANPASVYAMRHWFADPARRRPVDHRLLVFLLRRAGFARVAVEWHSPVPPGERLAGGDDDARRLDRLLFADQGYAVVATR